MKLEQQVVSLEYAKKLKELGVKQESLFGWTQNYTRKSGEFKKDSKPYLQYKGSFDYSAYTVAELGEMLPKEILAETINKNHPIRKHNDEEGEEWDKMQELIEEDIEKLNDVFNDNTEFLSDLELENGFPYNLKRSFGDGLEISYFQVTDEWESNYGMIEINGNTEADARAKLLIYLIENGLITI